MNRILFFICFISIQMVAQDFTIIVMPDTQHYCDDPPSEYIFAEQTQWIVDNRVSKNIVFVTGLGDVVQNADLTYEWDIADDAYSLIEDPATTTLMDGIPYGLVVGNCDQFPKRNTGATTNFNSYFGVNRFSSRGYYGGSYDATNNNSYQLFSGGGLDFIIIHLEFDESDPPSTHEENVLDWADGLLTTHSNRRAIISSHFLIEIGNQANGNGEADFGDQGEAIFDELKDHENLFLMLCGHISTEGERVDVGTNGNTIYTLLSDYQNQPNGGDGWLRIMEFSPGNNTITVSTFSPTINPPSGTFGTDDPTSMGNNSKSAPFTLAYDMTTPLPVELVDFQVRKVGEESMISWGTASEENNKGFEIQKSDDGVGWEKLTWVDGLGTTNISQSYSYVDKDPNHGTNYYRLRQIDNDDSETFSAVRVVTFDFALEAPIIYPNPIWDELTIEMPRANTGKVTFEIKDIMGRVVMVEKIILEDKIYRINTSSLGGGLYYLNIHSKSALVSHSFVKMN